MPGSSNFQVFNPTATNTETDAQYTTDGLRTGGIAYQAILPSVLLNKLFYQISMFCAAFAAALAGKGYAVSDSNYANLVAVLGNVLTNADQVGQLINVAFSPNPQFNAAQSTGFSMTLSGNILQLSIVNTHPGQMLTFAFLQDGNGGRTVAWPSNVRGAGNPDTTPGALSIQQFFCLLDGTIRAASPMTVS